MSSDLTAPRLPQQSPGDTIRYAPISGTAVASLVAAGLFVFLVALLGLLAYGKGKPLEEPGLLFLPVLAVVLAFVARRQIRASEGTRTGERYAELGWLIGVVGGLLFLAYIFAIDFVVEREARRTLSSFGEAVAKADPANPRDPSFLNAVYLSISAGQRNAVAGPTDAEGIARAFGSVVQELGRTDIVQVFRRYPGEVRLEPRGTLGSKRTQTGVESVLSAVAITPGGEYSFVVPMLAEFDDKKQRNWRLMPPMSGSNGAYLKPGGRNLNAYGWHVEATEQSATLGANELIASLQAEGPVAAYLKYVRPGSSAAQGAEMVKQLGALSVPRAAVAGVMSLLPPVPADFARDLAAVSAYPDGRAMSSEDAARLFELWNSPGRIAPAGAITKAPAPPPEFAAGSNMLKATVAAELVVGLGGSPPPVAPASLLLAVAPDYAPTLSAKLAELKASARGSALSPTPPAGLDEFLKGIPWRLEQLRTDFKPVAKPQPKQAGPGGPGGGMGGMMGGG